MSKNTAWAVQCAVIIGLIGGSDVPPLRLSTIKSCHQQGMMGGCLDKDCPCPVTCLGNRIEIHGEGEAMCLKYVAPHHKNEGRTKAKAICVTIPKGVLSDLTFLHITKGQPILTRSSSKHNRRYLFVSKYGNGFSDSTFPNWFKTQIYGVSDTIYLGGLVWAFTSTLQVSKTVLIETPTIPIAISYPKYRAHVNNNHIARCPMITAFWGYVG